MLSVILPVFNEEGTIQQIIERVQAVALPDLEREIIVVDDGSHDQTPEILKTLGAIRFFRHEKNQGKGAAVKTGIAQATGDLLLVQDADLEYAPQDYPALLKPILDGQTEFVMGSRFLFQRPKFFTKEGEPFFSHYIGNRLIIVLANLLYGQKNTDYEGCYKVFTRSLIQSFSIKANGFAFENELTCKALRRGYRIVEVPIRYKPRLYSEGKKITWRDGLSILWNIVKWRFLPF